MIIHKAFRYRIYPTKEQASFLNKTFGCTRFAYNQMLAFRIDDYEENKDVADYKFKKKTIKELREEFPFLTEVSADALGYESLFLDRAYKNFFRDPKTVGFPKFKKKQTAQSFSDKGRALNFLDNGSKTTHFTIPRLRKSPIKIIMHRELEGRPVTFTISRNSAYEFYIAIQCEVDIIDYALPSTGKSVGIDLGLTNVATLSDGNTITNPRHLKQALQTLAKEQRKLSKKAEMAKKENRKLSDSKNYQKQKLKVAKIHNKIVNQRTHFIHTQTQELVNIYDVIAVEKLQSKRLVQDADKDDWSNRTLARNVSDVSWFTFATTLLYKAAWNGRTAVQIDPFYPSSQLCSTCGHNDGPKDFKIRHWTCPSCGGVHDRNINTSINVLNEGLRMLSA